MGDRGDDDAGPDVLDGSCVVVADRGGPFEDRFKAVVAPALAAEGIAEGATRWISASAFGAGLPTGEAAAEVVRTLVQCTVAVIDVTAGRPDAVYLLAMSHMLRDSLTLGAHVGPAPSDWRLAAFAADFVPLEEPATAKDLAAALTGARNPRERFYAGPLRGSRSFAASLADPTLKEKGQVEEYERADRTMRIGVALGDICDQSRFGVWVNSENTEMEMARVTDKSVSARIRFRGSGAKENTVLAWKQSGDLLYRDLAHLMGSRRDVRVGSVLVTPVRGGSMLADENKVEAVAHVAAVKAETPFSGFVAQGRTGDCVTNVLDEIDVFRRRRWRADKARPLKSVLFPLMGAGDGGASPETVAATLVQALARYFQPAGTGPERGQGADFFTLIGIAAYRGRDADACRDALGNCGFTRVKDAAS